MRVLAIHNYYQQRGGEDQCFEDEVQVLKAHGHQVLAYTVHNDSIEHRSKLNVARQSIWNTTAYAEVLSRVQQFKPDVVHVMNTFPLLSPSILYAIKKTGTAVVHEVQNYRMFCANALMLRNGQHCQDCLDKKFAWPAIIHRCYRDSLPGSATQAIASSLHRSWRTWHKVVDLFLAPSRAARELLVRGGLPEQRVIVKPNALNSDPGMGCGSSDGFVFVGRLSPEKGLRTLFEVWQKGPDLPILKVIGDGPDQELVRQASARDARIQWLGRLPLDQLLEVVGQSRALIMPSLWNETFGRTTIEAFSKGTPVIGSRIGGTQELITEGQTGWLFAPGSADELLEKVRLVSSLCNSELADLRKQARQVFLTRYQPENNYRALIDCYQLAQSHSNQSISV